MSVAGRAQRALDALLELSVAGSFSRIGIAVRRRVERWQPLELLPAAELTVVASGVTSGIGRAAVSQLAENGARIVGLARDTRRAKAVLCTLPPPASGVHLTIECDLSDMHSVRRAGAELRASDVRVDRLLHVAGVLPPSFSTTPAGVETTLATHLLGPYLLTRELEGSFRPSARVIWVSSAGMYTQPLKLELLEMTEATYEGRRAYARAKRAQVVASELLSEEYRGSAQVHSMHPGWVATPILKHGMPLFNRALGPILRTPREGADTLVWLTLAADAGASTAGFWHDRRRRRTVSWPGTRTAASARAGLLPWIERRIERASSSPAHPRPERGAQS